jgi:aminopeptidase N
MLSEWRGYSKDCANAGPLYAANMLGGAQGWQDRQCLLYYRGPLVMHMFRTTVGEPAFFAAMRKFLEDSSEPVGTEDLKKACKATLRADMGWFWDEWIHKGGVPEVRVVHSIRNEGGKVVLSGRVEQPPDRFIKLIVPLVLDMPGGQRDVRVFVQEQPSQDFRFELAGTPTKVTVDPANNNLAVYR